MYITIYLAFQQFARILMEIITRKDFEKCLLLSKIVGVKLWGHLSRNGSSYFTY